MTIRSRLLLIPLEIRHHIYSSILRNEYIIDMIAADVTCRRESGLFLACHQLHREASEYYYEYNTFQLSLGDPTYSPDAYLDGQLTLMKRLGRMRNLHLELGPERGFSESDETDSDLAPQSQEQTGRWNRFVEQLTATQSGQAGCLLKTLVMVDRSSYCLIPSHCSHPKDEQTTKMSSRLEWRMAALSRLLRPLMDRVGNLRIEMRSPYHWTPYVPIGNYAYGLILFGFVKSGRSPAISGKGSFPRLFREKSRLSYLHECYTKVMNKNAHMQPNDWYW